MYFKAAGEVFGAVAKLDGHFGLINVVDNSLDDLLNSIKTDFPITWKFDIIGDDAFEVIDGTGN